MNSPTRHPPTGSDFTIPNILQATFYLFKRNWLHYMVVAVIVILIFSLTTSVLFPNFEKLAFSLQEDLSPIQAQEAASVFMQQFLLIWAFRSIIFFLGAAVMAFGVMQGFRNQRLSVLKSISFTLPQAPFLIILAVLISTLFVLGILFFIFPGIIVMLIFTPIVPVCLLERSGVLASLSRSKQLMSNVSICLQTLAVTMIIGLPILLLPYIMYDLFSGVVFLFYISNILAQALCIALLNIAGTVIYFFLVYQRDEKNADDIAQSLGWDNTLPQE